MNCVKINPLVRKLLLIKNSKETQILASARPTEPVCVISKEAFYVGHSDSI